METILALPRFYFGFRERVGRRQYLLAGVVLMAVKYAVDAAVIWGATRQPWTPADYLLPLMTIRAEKVEALPPGLAAAMVAWTLPFVWVGVSMTLRRAVDAGRSPWLCLLFFVPVVNYLLFLWLAALPSASGAAEWDASPVAASVADRWRSALLAVAASVGVGAASVLLGAVVMQTYGVALFLAAPFVLGLFAAYIHNRGHPRTAADTSNVVTLSLFVVGGTLILFALEGLLCVAMAFPLALVPALLGGGVGRAVAVRARVRPGTTAYALLLLPTAALADHSAPPPRLYEARTSIVIEAPPERVWENVIAFHDITADPGLPFRLGIAYPIRARIVGSGVGAVRYCEFSTGPFVEPVTTWDAPRRLGFDVAEQPAALREWSPYRTVYAPHVKGFFRSARGEFLLVELAGGRTRLEGSTWYTLDVHPHAYWRPIAEWLLTGIHTRVLQQVKRETESALPAAGGGSGSIEIDRRMEESGR